MKSKIKTCFKFIIAMSILFVAIICICHTKKFAVSENDKGGYIITKEDMNNYCEDGSISNIPTDVLKTSTGETLFCAEAGKSFDPTGSSKLYDALKEGKTEHGGAPSRSQGEKNGYPLNLTGPDGDGYVIVDYGVIAEVEKGYANCKNKKTCDHSECKCYSDTYSSFKEKADKVKDDVASIKDLDDRNSDKTKLTTIELEAQGWPSGDEDLRTEILAAAAYGETHGYGDGQKDIAVKNVVQSAMHELGGGKKKGNDQGLGEWAQGLNAQVKALQNGSRRSKRLCSTKRC